MKQVGNTILAKGGNHILAKRDNSAWPKGSKLSGFSTKNLHIEISYMYENYWTYDILTIPRHDLIGLSDRPIIRYNTYEEALEAGLQEALKLI